MCLFIQYLTDILIFDRLHRDCEAFFNRFDWFCLILSVSIGITEAHTTDIVAKFRQQLCKIHISIDFLGYMYGVRYCNPMCKHSNTFSMLPPYAADILQHRKWSVAYPMHIILASCISIKTSTQLALCTVILLAGLFFPPLHWRIAFEFINHPFLGHCGKSEKSQNHLASCL